MPISAVLGFWGVAALLIVVPGPDWAFAIGAGLRGHVGPAAAGIVAGYLAMTLVVAAGVGVLVASSPAALTVLTVVGGAYLVWLGARTVARPPGSTVGGSVPRTAAATVAQGIGVSGLNPKGLLVFVGLLPQFTDPHAGWPIAAQLAALGLVFTLTCAVVYPIVGSCAHRILHARPGTARAVSRTAGACMVVIGVTLLVERVLL